MNVRSMTQQCASPAAAAAEADAAARARAVLEQMYAYFSWDDLPFDAEAEQAESYALVA